MNSSCSRQEKIVFPDPNQAQDDGLLCYGGNLNVPTLLEAYQKGIFPWPHPGYPILWYSPDPRGVLFFDEFHLSCSFKKFLRKTDYSCSFNRNFKNVIINCGAQKRIGQSGTWILPEMIESYIEFHKAGYAHSVECWQGDELVGGLYGVYVGAVFSGESMFFKKENASKFCLYHLVEFLKSQNIKWMDIQMVTPVLKAFGGREIPRLDFLKMIKKANEENDL